MAKEFMEDYVPAKLFSYSKPLVRKTRQLVDLVMAVSGSPQEVVERIRGTSAVRRGIREHLRN